uniref:Peptidase M56, BlaR1 n=1 Tax=Solibacter usitatus (strain Ellin6076) TaxID=234267 RepID=Q020C7_SOLUE
MKVFPGVAALLLWHCASFAQSFEVASVKPSRQTLGRDFNKAVVFGASSVTGRNVTLKNLIVAAYNVQPHQVFGGPKWLDDSEYDLDAKADGPVAKEQLRLMLRALLAERFRLALHRETKELHVYELVVDKGGPKIHAAKEPAGPGARSLEQLANLISVQLTIPEPTDPGKPSIASGAPIPVIDKTGLTGVYEITYELRPEPGMDMFKLWQQVLQGQLGLKLESRKAPVEVLILDNADRIPVAN